MKRTQIWDPVYGQNVTVYSHCKRGDHEKINRIHRTRFEEHQVAGYDNGGKGAVMYFCEGSNQITLTHEAVHHALRVFEECHIKVSDKHSEAFAYYVQFLVSFSRLIFSR